MIFLNNFEVLIFAFLKIMFFLYFFLLIFYLVNYHSENFEFVFLVHSR
ncbi:hypothetical protein Avbf_08857 [Armadillidium vulgare]|nr:hypothetical protein Avbf_08857 [Armadillidium vulgare]